MNIIDKIFSRTRPEPETKWECTYSSGFRTPDGIEEKDDRSSKINYDGIGRTTYGSGQPPAIYDDALKAYKNYPIVYSCVTAISDAISSLGVKVYKIKGGEKVEDTGHDFHDIFRNPNPFQGSQEFLEQICINLDLGGNCFIALEGRGSTIEMYVLISKYVSIIPDAKKKVAEYRYIINGQIIKYKPEEIIHIKYSNPEDPYYGMSPLTPSTEVLSLESNRLKFASAFFKNSAVPPAVLQTESVMSETVLNKLRGDWERLHSGAKNFGRIAILQGGLKFTPLASPLKDLDLNNLKTMSNSDIMMLYRIPASVLGDQNNVSGEEGKAALTAFFRNAILPRVKRIETALNRGLKDLVLNGGKVVFEFDLKNVPALQDEKVALASYLEKMVGASIMTPNDARSVLGLPMSKDEWSNSLLVSNSFFGQNMIPTSEIGNQGAGSNTAKPSNNPKNPTGGGK